MDMDMVMGHLDIIMAAGLGRIRAGIKGLRGWGRVWIWEDREG